MSRYERESKMKALLGRERYGEILVTELGGRKRDRKKMVMNGLEKSYRGATKDSSYQEGSVPEEAPFNPMIDFSRKQGLLDYISNKVADSIAQPSQRPGPAGSVIQNDPSLPGGSGFFDAGENVINLGSQLKNAPIAFAHELGHQQQFEDQGSTRYNVNTAVGNLNELAHGEFQHTLENSGPNELRAPAQGMERLRAAAEGGDFQAAEILKALDRNPKLGEIFGIATERAGEQDQAFPFSFVDDLFNSENSPETSGQETSGQDRGRGVASGDPMQEHIRRSFRRQEKASP